MRYTDGWSELQLFGLIKVIQGITMANNEITRLSFTTTECRSAIIMNSKFCFFITEKQNHITYN